MSAQSIWVRTRRLSALLLISLSACGDPPSKTEADAALKEMLNGTPLVGQRLQEILKNPDLHMVSDLKCTKTGDQQFRCQVLMEENAVMGVQRTVPLDFVKLAGKWRASDLR